jgi:predicted RNase H-like nuclease (RuvC/YqgF family)
MINKRALIHLESILDQEKIKSKENQEIFHRNEKAYLAEISKLTKQNSRVEAKLGEMKAKLEVAEANVGMLKGQLDASKAENLMLKEERDEGKVSYLEEIDKLREDLGMNEQ